MLSLILGSFFLNNTFFTSPQNSNILAFCSRKYFDHSQFSGKFISPTSCLACPAYARQFSSCFTSSFDFFLMQHLVTCFWCAGGEACLLRVGRFATSKIKFLDIFFSRSDMHYFILSLRYGTDPFFLNPWVKERESCFSSSFSWCIR